MTREEALDIVAIIASAWSQQWGLEEMESYALAIGDADAEWVTKAVLRAQRETRFRPAVAEILERARVERKMAAMADHHNIPPEKQPRPEWVLRWARARMAGDWRPFPEQATAMRDQGWDVPDTMVSDADAWVQLDEYTEGDTSFVLPEIGATL